ncbi:MAG TPA: peptidoglycan-binding protein, partial [Candidatus Paceibacterota bacterium]|nr:peptidoglycan-binding protein [Candidatus Paceibacterota bacterium]
SSATTSAASGNNTITFSFLSDGTYSNCTITVTDPTGNASNVLSVSSFTVSAAPILAEVIPIPPTTSDTTPNYTFSSTEAGTISYGGSCSSATTSAASGNNTITFSTLADGVYSNCTITVTDGNSMASDPLAVDSFTVDTIPDTTSILYGIDGSGQNPDPPHLYILNTTTGQKQTDVGAVGFYVTGMAFHPDTNVLYGSTGNTGSNTKSLITINKDTGAGTLLGALKDGSNGTHTLADIEFRSNGTLYGWSTNGNDLYTVDLTSCNGTSDTNCLVTKVGEFGSSAFGNGLVFDTNDNLYLFRQGDDNFNTLDPDTGLSIEQTNFSNPSGNGYTIPAATINGDGVIYAPRLNYGSSPSDLITIAMDTGTITSLGDTADMLYMDALAFYFPPDTTAPAISAISVTATQSTATITWTTDESSSSSVQYGLTTSYGSSGTGSGSTTSHSVTLTSLAACTTYNYKAVSVDSASNSGESSNQTVTTSGCTSSVSGSVARSAVSPVVPFIPTTPTSTPTPSPAAPVVFTRALVLGKKDPAVKKLQQYLNAHSFTISRVGAGSPGKETDFFGIKTKAALIRFQEAHAADILIPLGLKKGTGNLGPRTRAYIATHP